MDVNVLICNDDVYLKYLKEQTVLHTLTIKHKNNIDITYTLHFDDWVPSSLPTIGVIIFYKDTPDQVIKEYGYLNKANNVKAINAVFNTPDYTEHVDVNHTPTVLLIGSRYNIWNPYNIMKPIRDLLIALHQ